MPPLAPGEALRIWTGAKNPASLPLDPANLQAPFGLSKSADQVCLFTPELELADRVSYNWEQRGDASTGRWPNGAGGVLTTLALPTPAQPNRHPRFMTALLEQPPAYTLPEEQPFVCTNSHLLGAQTPPANLTFRLYPVEGGELPRGVAFDTQNAVLSWTPDEDQGPGIYPLRLLGYIADGLDITPCDDVLLTLNVIETTRPPLLWLNPGSDHIVIDEHKTVTFTVGSTRQEEIPARFVPPALLTVESAHMPPAAHFNPATGVFTWATDEPDGPTNITFTITARDPDDPALCATTNLLITVNEVNRPLVYASPTTFYLWRNEPFAVHLRYTDPDLPPNTFSFSRLSGPEGLTVNNVTGLLEWQPTPQQTGTFSARVRAFDGAGSAINTTISLVVDTGQLTATALAAQDGALELQWRAKRDALYTIEWCADIGAPDWQPLNTVPIAGSNAIISHTINPAEIGAPPTAFFRIRQDRE